MLRFCLLVAALAGSLAFASDAWPAFRGPRGDGAAPADAAQLEHLQSGLRLLWSRPFQDDKSLDKGPEYGRYHSYSAPAVQDGRIYVCRRSGNADELACLDARTGADIWRYQLESETVKKNFGGGIRGVPCIHGEFIFIVNYWNVLVCLKRADGSLHWKKDLRAEYSGKLPDFGVSASPVILDGKLIVHPCGPGSAIAALDPATGKELWKGGTHDPAYATPQAVTLGGVPQILAFLASGLASYDAATGRELWTFKYYEAWQKNSCVPLVIGDTVFVGNNTLGVTAFVPKKSGDSWTTSVLWSSQREKWHFSSALLHGLQLVGNDGKGAVKALDPQSGKVLWAVSDMGRTWAGLLRLGEQHLLAATDTGQLAVIHTPPNAAPHVTRYHFMGVAFVQPAVADGRLYLQDFQKVYCLALTPQLAAGEGELLKPLPPVPEDHSFMRYLRQHFKTFRVGWLAAASMALLGMLFAQAGQRASGTASAGFAALGIALALYLAATSAGPDAKRFAATRFGTNMALIFGALGGGVLAVMGLLCDTRARHGVERATVAILSALTLVGLFAFSRTNLAQVDIGSLLASAQIRDRTAAYGDMQGALGIALILVLLLFRQSRWSGSILHLQSPQRVFLGLLGGVALAYSVRHTGVALTLACFLFAPLAAQRLAPQRVWLAYWIAPILAVLTQNAGFYLAFRTHASPGWLAAVCVASASILVVLVTILLARLPREIPDPTPLPRRSRWAVRSAAFAFVLFGIQILDNSVNLRALAQDYSPHNIARYRPDFITGGQAQWPTFRGPYHNNFVPAGDWPTEFTRDEHGKTKNIRWEVPEVPGKGRSSPILWEKHLFLTTATETHLEVLCYDTETGAQRWRTPIAAAPTDKLPLSGWAAPTGICNGTHFVALFSSGDIAALDFNGTIVWKKNLGKLQNMYGYGSSLMLWKDRVFVQLDVDPGTPQPVLLALNPATGDTLWSQVRKEGASWSTPAVLRTRSGDQLVTCAAPNVVAYNPDSGSELWRAGVLNGDVVPTAIFARGRAIVCNDQAALAAIDCDGSGDVTKSKVAWKQTEADFPDTASPITDGEFVLLFGSNAKVNCWRAATGEKVWEKEFDNGFTASPVLVGKEIYAFNSNGILFRIDPGESYDEISQSELNDNVSATPAFAHRRIFVRGERGLYCIGK